MSVGVECSGAFSSPVSRLFGDDSGELILDESMLFSAGGGDPLGCLFEMSCVILLCIEGVITGLGLLLGLGLWRHDALCTGLKSKEKGKK